MTPHLRRGRPRVAVSGRQSLGSTWIFGPGPAADGRSREHRRHAAESDRSRDERARVDSAAGERVDRPGQARRGGEEADCRDILQCNDPGVDGARRPGQADVDHSLAGFDQIERHRRQLGGVRGVDDGVVRHAGHLVGGPHALEPQRPGELAGPRRPPDQVHLGPGCPGEHRYEQADRARAEHQQPIAGGESSGVDGTQRVAAGLDESSQHGVDGVGQGIQRPDRHGQLLGECSGPSAPDAALVTELADVLLPTPAAAAPATAEHGGPR